MRCPVCDYDMAPLESSCPRCADKYRPQAALARSRSTTKAASRWLPRWVGIAAWWTLAAVALSIGSHGGGTWFLVISFTIGACGVARGLVTRGDQPVDQVGIANVATILVLLVLFASPVLPPGRWKIASNFEHSANGMIRPGSTRTHFNGAYDMPYVVTRRLAHTHVVGGSLFGSARLEADIVDTGDGQVVGKATGDVVGSKATVQFEPSIHGMSGLEFGL